LYAPPVRYILVLSGIGMEKTVTLLSVTTARQPSEELRASQSSPFCSIVPKEYVLLNHRAKSSAVAASVGKPSLSKEY
jgi:hypothetical protein